MLPHTPTLPTNHFATQPVTLTPYLSVPTYLLAHISTFYFSLAGSTLSRNGTTTSGVLRVHHCTTRMGFRKACGPQTNPSRLRKGEVNLDRKCGRPFRECLGVCSQVNTGGLVLPKQTEKKKVLSGMLKPQKNGLVWRDPVRAAQDIMGPGDSESRFARGIQVYGSWHVARHETSTTHVWLLHHYIITKKRILKGAHVLWINTCN